MFESTGDTLGSVIADSHEGAPPGVREAGAQGKGCRWLSRCPFQVPTAGWDGTGTQLSLGMATPLSPYLSLCLLSGNFYYSAAAWQHRLIISLRAGPRGAAALGLTLVTGHRSPNYLLRLALKLTISCIHIG